MPSEPCGLSSISSALANSAYAIALLQPLAGLVAAVLLGPNLLEFSEDGVSYLGVAMCSAVLMLASLRIQSQAPGRWAWAWILASGAFAGTALRLQGWPAVPVWPPLLALSPWLAIDLWRGFRHGGLMRWAAALMIAPFAIGYGVGSLPVTSPAFWAVAQVPLYAAVALAAALSFQPRRTPCPN